MTTILQKPLTFMSHPLLRYVYAVGYTAILLVILLQSSSQPVVGPSAPAGEPPLEREIMLIVGHVVGFSLLPLLWWWAFDSHLSFKQALIIAVVIALFIGAFTEIAQADIPDRSASWFDLAVNWGMTMITAFFINRYAR